MPRFLKDNQYYIDLEDRALFLTITNQRYAQFYYHSRKYIMLIYFVSWMAIRLDFMGGLMVFVVCSDVNYYE